jgi:hypothetical protein
LEEVKNGNGRTNKCQNTMLTIENKELEKRMVEWIAL